MIAVTLPASGRIAPGMNSSPSALRLVQEADSLPVDAPADDGLPLRPQHRKMLLVDSAIDPSVLRERGVITVTKKTDLDSRGFRQRPQQVVPTLLLPIHTVHGEIYYHHRPDSGYCNAEGKICKYVFPPGMKMHLDAHPRIRPQLGNPETPLFVTEGIKKADAAISRGLCCVALLGVWNWRGCNETGGLTALSDWEWIAFKGKDATGQTFSRLVYVCFDSDVMTKPPVYQALYRLGRFLHDRGAHVLYVYLPSGEYGIKVGLDDFFAAGHTVDEVLHLASPHLKAPPEEEKADPPVYEATEEGLIWNQETSRGVRRQCLCNFTAHLVAQVTEDDGAEVRRLFHLRVRQKEREQDLFLPLSAFLRPHWALEHLGAGYFVLPGHGYHEHLPIAIQVLSGEVPERHIYTHLGWRQLPDGEWVYLHAGGAIGSQGIRPDIQVRLNDPLHRFRLPNPASGQALVNDIQELLHLLRLGAAEICYPLLGLLGCTPLGRTDFTLHLSGETGAFKTAVAMLLQQCWGAEMTDPPLGWNSTANAVAGYSFLAADTLLLIDDYVSRGNAQEDSLSLKADLALRAQANGTPRHRLRSDGTLREARPPRATVLSTGEDIPTGHSLRGRLLTLTLERGCVDRSVLSACQQAARQGAYARCLAAYVQSLASQIGTLRTKMPQWIEERRTIYRDVAAHPQHSDHAAQLHIGLEQLFSFFHSAGALSKEEADSYCEQGEAALRKTLQAQHRYIEAADPARRFLDLLVSALSAGGAHLADRDGQAPEDAEIAWGWRSAPDTPIWRAVGERIGWVDGEDVYLQPEAAYRTACKMGILAASLDALKASLKARGWLETTDTTRKTLTVRRTCESKRLEVLHLSALRLLEGIDVERGSEPEATDADPFG